MNEWMDDAACKNTDPNDWFPEEYSLAHDNKMTRICIEQCPVQEQCLNYAIEHREKLGIWGGFTQQELKGIRTKRFSRCRYCGRRWPKARLTAQTTCRYCRLEMVDAKGQGG